MPAREPVTLSDMKAHLTLDASFTDDDALISGMIAAARQDAEDFLGQSLVPQQWLFALDWFPTYRILDAAPSRSDYDALGNYNFNGWRWNHSQTITIPRPPLMSLDSIQYTDLAGMLQTLDPETYQVDSISSPARIMPGLDSYWPQVAPVVNAVQIRFTSGYVQDVQAELITVPATAPYTVTIAQAANFAKLLTLLDAVSGAPVTPLQASASGTLTFAAAQAGESLLATYQVVAIPATIQAAIKLRAAAYYANCEEFLAGVSAVVPDWFERMLGGAGRTHIFGYVGR